MAAVQLEKCWEFKKTLYEFSILEIVRVFVLNKRNGTEWKAFFALNLFKTLVILFHQFNIILKDFKIESNNDCNINFLLVRKNSIKTALVVFDSKSILLVDL